MDNLLKEWKGKIPGAILTSVKKESVKRGLSKPNVKKVLEKLKDIYDTAKIDSGESIGIITAESFGEPGTQMSVAGDEKIIVKIKDRIKIIEISKFVDSLMNQKSVLNLDNSDILPLNDFEISVPSLNKNEKIEWKKVIECSRHKTNKKLMKLVTKSGRSITATDNHSFVIRKNNDVVPIVGRELGIGDRIPVINHLPENCISEIGLKNYIDKGSRFAIVEKNNLLIREKTHCKPLPAKLKLNESFGWFVGAYLAEGNATHGQVNISNMDNCFIGNAKEFIGSLGLDYVEDYHQRGFSLSRDLKINSTLLASFLRNTCKTGSANKIVPDFCYSAKEEFVSGLLRGYFDGEGNFTVDRKMIRVSSNSEELCKGISLLLRRFKIFSYRTKDKKGQYCLLIPYKYAGLFLEKIGSDIEHKLIALEKLADMSKKFWNDKSQDYTDMISGFGDLFLDVSKKLDYPTRYVNNFTKRQKIGRTVLFRYMKLFEKLAKDKNIDIKKELDIMGKMFYSEVIWDEIVNVEYVDCEGEYVYDLSVPGLETFTTFDGIVTHNTLNVFHFAGVAEVSVSQGLPRIIELFDARKTIKTPMMEIYLHKEYNQDANKVRKIASRIKEIKLEEYATNFVLNLAKLQIEVNLNMKKLRDVGLKIKDLATVLDTNLKGAKVREGAEKVIISSTSEENVLIELYKLKEKSKETYISGVKGVIQVLPVKDKDEFIILTAGTNLKDVLAIKEVDEVRTTCNDVFEIANVLGIEAARTAVMNEAMKIFRDQGLDVDIRHFMFIADIITASGFIKGITRSGITGEKESVLARASFETPIKHIVNASLMGEEDHLNSVVENVMLNQPVPLGTGLPDLVTRVKEVNKK